MPNKITPKQWKLYRLLESEPTKWFTQKEICDAISDYKYIDDPRNHCAEIGKDRIVLNASPITDKIITTYKHKFKIATLDEYVIERAAHIRRLKCQAEQIRNMDAKFLRDGQGKLFNNILNELTDENEQFHDTFIREK